MSTKKPHRSPQELADEYVARTRALAESAAPAFIAPAFGKAVLDLAEAGMPVTNASLIARLLAEAEQHPLVAPACHAAARKLGWAGT